MPGGRTLFSAVESPEEFLACQRLANALLPATRLRALLEAADHSPIDALGFSSETLRGRLGLTERQVVRLQDAVRLPLPPRLLDQARALNASILTFQDPVYPANLLPLSDSPPILFVRGALHPDDRFAVAIVGSRRSTLYGQEQSDRFARAFAERGLCVVSGGAAGIDTAAHRGAVEAGGRTIAVLGCGIDVPYPATNRTLFARIAERSGAVISEFPMGTKPEPWRFPTRNRIIAGIAQATLVVETPEDSGALITARNAGEYGRDVWVVPGPVDSGRSRGGHKLVQDGAGLADSPDDVLYGLGLAPQNATPPAKMPQPLQPSLALPDPAPASAPKTQRRTPAASPAPPPAAPAPPPVPANLTPDEAALLAQFDLTPRHLDQASAPAGLSAPQATVAATLLEMKSLIRRLPGNLFVRNL